MITRRKLLSMLAALPLFGGLFAVSAEGTEAGETLRRRDRLLRRALEKYRKTHKREKPGLEFAECEPDTGDGELLFDEEGVRIVRFSDRLFLNGSLTIHILTIDTNKYLEAARCRGRIGGRCRQIVVCKEDRDGRIVR